MTSSKAFTGPEEGYGVEDASLTRSANGSRHGSESRRVSTVSSSSPRRNSNGVGDVRRRSFANSLQVPKHQQHHLAQQQSQQSNQKRKWNKYHQSEGFDFDPLVAASSSAGSSSKLYRSLSSSPRSGSTTANDQESKESGTPNGSMLIPGGKIQSEEEREKIKEVGQLASVFLEIRKNIMSDFNIDLAHNENLDLERDKNIPGQVRLRNISRATIQRAEKVKVMLNLYYFYVFSSQRGSQPKFASVDGVFNPLQVIRNRRIRKKYHQPPKLAIKTLPYASTVFSRSKNKLIWQVDLTELTYDFNWRAQHWHELVDPHGELWFPPEEDPTHHHGHHHHRHRHRPHLPHHHSDKDKEISHIHDKLFETSDEIDGHESSNNSSKDDITSDTTRPRRRDKIASKIRKRSKSPYKRKREQNSKEQLNDGFEFENEKSNPDLSSTDLMHTDSNNGSFKGNLLNDISIEPLKNHQRELSSSDSNGQTNGGDATAVSSSSRDSDDLEIEELRTLNSYLHKLRKLDDLINFGEHHLSVKEREYSQLINFQKIVKDIDEIRQSSKYLKESVFTKYEHLLTEKSSYLEYYQNEMANNYSPRVDKLLLLSDRTVGEVNTTLSLEVRKLTERLEKLGPSYKRAGSLVHLAYWLLENLIVLLLWSIWIGFSIGKVFKFFALSIWWVVKWVFY